MKKLKTILVDDEEHCIETLQWQISQHIPEIEIIQTFSVATDALRFLKSEQVDLIFLDIEMPELNAFELLEQLPEINFEIIFATAYDQFAVKAFKASAIDYLLKPIDIDDLKKAVKKVLSKEKAIVLPEQMEILYHALQKSPQKKERIALPTHEGVHFVKLHEIMYCISESNYTKLYLINSKKIMVSRTLKEIEAMLPERDFLRIHHSHVINLQKIEKYVRSDGGYVIMDDNKTLSVSRSRKNDLLRFFES